MAEPMKFAGGVVYADPLRMDPDHVHCGDPLHAVCRLCGMTDREIMYSQDPRLWDVVCAGR